MICQTILGVNSFAFLVYITKKNIKTSLDQHRFLNITLFLRKFKEFFHHIFRIDFKKLYIHYLPASNAVSKKLYVVAPNKLFRSVRILSGSVILLIFIVHYHPIQNAILHETLKKTRYSIPLINFEKLVNCLCRTLQK